MGRWGLGGKTSSKVPQDLFPVPSRCPLQHENSNRNGNVNFKLSLAQESRGRNWIFNYPALATSKGEKPGH